VTETDLAFAVIGYGLGLLTAIGIVLVTRRVFAGWRCAFCGSANRAWWGSCRRCR
jgi:hypothetical protein